MVTMGDDIVSVCSDEFLRMAVKHCVATRDAQNSRYSLGNAEKAATILALCSIGELLLRGAKIRSKLVDQLRSFLIADGHSMLRHPDKMRLECKVGDRIMVFSLSELESAAEPAS